MTSNAGPTTNNDAGKASKRMTSESGRRALLVLVIVLAALIIVVALIRPPNIDVTNAATILALVTAGSVTIERILEGFWTVVGTSSLGSWWPLKPIGDRLDKFVDQLNEPLNAFFKEAQAQVSNTTKVSDSLSHWLDDAGTYLSELEGHIKKLQLLEPGNPKARAIANGASRAVVGLEKHYPQELKTYATKANAALASVDQFVQTFEDNPARRLMSLYAGAVLGLLAAGILGLDVVQAVFQGKPSIGLIGALYDSPLKGIGVVATGLAMGAGSSPTHELIKTLKETKERNKRTAHSP